MVMGISAGYTRMHERKFPPTAGIPGWRAIAFGFIHFIYASAWSFFGGALLKVSFPKSKFRSFDSLRSLLMNMNVEGVGLQTESAS
jgi:hypothetical protein